MRETKYLLQIRASVIEQLAEDVRLLLDGPIVLSQTQSIHTAMTELSPANTGYETQLITDVATCATSLVFAI